MSMAKTRDGRERLTAEQRSAVDAFDAGEDIGTGEAVEVEARRPLGKVVPIRMSDDQWRVLSREAEELGVRPTTLMRMWVLERLREAERGHRGTPGAPTVQAGRGDAGIEAGPLKPTARAG